ncbi:hypothetical protein EDC94DRAFT_641160 [Helicostylum pulchrum]|nr:hypothetical protein EDC94DRAFT_641160 [Helicostylum pulchrum]
MNQLVAIGLNSKGFPPFRAQLDYGLAISPITAKLVHKLDTFQNSCIRLMLHLVNLPSMRTRVAVLQAQYLFRSTQLPDDTLLTHLLPHLQSSSSFSHWYKLSKTRIWRSLCAPILSTLDIKQFYSLSTIFLDQEFQNLYTGSDSMLLASTHSTFQVDTILWLPMTHSERSRVLRWRLGWLPGENPISFLLNLLPLHPPRPADCRSWFTLWPILCTIIHELDYYFHDEPPPPPPPPIDPGLKLLNWLHK